jgi:hypothetical protein
MNIFIPKIEFYRLRDFAGKLNATFQFIRENWKPLLKFTFYLLLPICLIQTIVMNSFFNSYMKILGQSSDFNTFNAVNSFVNYGLYLLMMMLGSIMLSALVYALMQTYEQRESRLVNIQWADFKEQLIKNAKRTLLLTAFGIGAFLLLAILIGAIGAMLYLATNSVGLAVFLGFFLLMFVFVLILPITLMMPIYIFDTKINLRNTVVKAWTWGFRHFWSFLGFLIVIYIISSVIQSITMMPWYITILVGNVFSLNSDPTITQSVFYKFAVYILGLIQSMGTYVASIILMIGLAFQYFHLREKYEGVTIESNITHFDQLQ